MFTSLIRIETHTGPLIRVKNAGVRLRSQAFHVRLPLVNGGLTWNRPTAVVVQTSDGQYQILAIPDLTRLAMFALASISMIGVFLMLMRRNNSGS